MSDIDKQQENIPPSPTQTSPTQSEGLGENTGEMPPSADGGVGSNSNPEIDWELQVAQAYQQAEAADDSQDNSQKAEVKATANAELTEEIASLKEAKESLQSQLAAAQAQFEDVSGQYRRLAADFDNYRKRTQKEKEELDLQVKCATITKWLPILDNFERARAQIKPQNEGEMNIHKSYQSVYKQMIDSLKQLGVSPMRPEGQEFDPNLHEAVMREPTTEYPEGTVTEELVRGYIIGDRVLRHAMVKVAAAPEEPMVIEENPPETQEEQS
ncbi:MAG: nucleotide exchange factor GrpE [Okeania sp. SIO2H7]|nr:nucleotide exchange factor GrpE [Okeania sp. SIO2H7]